MNRRTFFAGAASAALAPFALAAATEWPHSVSGIDALINASVRAVQPLYPRGPRSGPGYVVPIHPHLTGPIRPSCRHIPTSPSRGLYEMPSLCMLCTCLGSPQLVLSFH